MFVELVSVGRLFVEPASDVRPARVRFGFFFATNVLLKLARDGIVTGRPRSVKLSGRRLLCPGTIDALDRQMGPRDCRGWFVIRMFHVKRRSNRLALGFTWNVRA